MEGNISTAKENGGEVLVIQIEGRFDYQLHRNFRDTYRDLTGIGSVVIDMRRTDYLDSSALGMLLLLRESVHGGGKKEIILRNVNPQIRNILNIAHFDRLFKIL